MCGVIFRGSYQEALLRLPRGFSVFRLQDAEHLGALVTE